MKKCKMILTVTVGIDLDTVANIYFKFKQGSNTLMFTYPSANAVRVDDDIQLIWTAEEAFTFNEGVLFMDTLIKVTDAVTNPETEIVKLYYNDTLFTKKEVEELG